MDRKPKPSIPSKLWKEHEATLQEVKDNASSIKSGVIFLNLKVLLADKAMQKLEESTKVMKEAITITSIDGQVKQEEPIRQRQPLKHSTKKDKKPRVAVEEKDQEEQEAYEGHLEDNSHEADEYNESHEVQQAHDDDIHEAEIKLQQSSNFIMPASDEQNLSSQPHQIKRNKSLGRRSRSRHSEKPSTTKKSFMISEYKKGKMTIKEVASQLHANCQTIEKWAKQMR